MTAEQERLEQDWSEHLRIQLAAEVDKVNKLQDQFAAEQEKVKSLTEALSEMTEHHANFGVRQERDEALRQLAAVVEALKRIKEMNDYISYPSPRQVVAVIDTALTQIERK